MKSFESRNVHWKSQQRCRSLVLSTSGTLVWHAAVVSVTLRGHAEGANVPNLHSRGVTPQCSQESYGLSAAVDALYSC